MAKSKEQRKQEKKAALQEAKKEQTKLAESNKVEEKVEAKDTEAKAQVKAVSNAEQINLTMYTLTYMIVTFLSAALTAYCLVIYGNPGKYVIKSYVGEGLNEMSREMLRLYMLDELGEGRINGFYLAIGIVIAVEAVAMLIGMIKAVDNRNKPVPVLNIIGIVMSIVALGIFMYADDFMKSDINRYDIDRQPELQLYSLYLPLLITNIVAMITGLITTIGGLNRWKKTGKTSK